MGNLNSLSSMTRTGGLPTVQKSAGKINVRRVLVQQIGRILHRGYHSECHRQVTNGFLGLTAFWGLSCVRFSGDLHPGESAQYCPADWARRKIALTAWVQYSIKIIEQSRLPNSWPGIPQDDEQTFSKLPGT